MTGEGIDRAQLAEKLDGDGMGGDDYYRARVADIKAGKPTWLRRNFDADHGRVYDYFVNSHHVSCLVEEYDYGCSVYTGEQGEISLSAEPLTIEAAVALTEEHDLPASPN